MAYLNFQLAAVRGGDLATASNLVDSVRQHGARLQVFGVIVLLHVAMIWALQNGLFGQIRRHMPAEIFVTLISAQTPEPAIAMAPKIVPVLQKNLKIIEPKALPVLSTESPLTEQPHTEANSASVTADILVSAASAPVHPAALPVHPITVSTGVEYIRPPQPIYPAQSRRMHEQGKTVLRVLVNENGLPESAEIQQSSGSIRLDDAARLAVLGALFKPFIDNGTPLAVYAIVPIRFQLDR